VAVIERTGGAGGMQAASARPRAELGKALVFATGIGLMVAIGVDLITGQWAAAPWLHILLAMLCVGAWLPLARRVTYLQYGPLYVLGLLVYTVLRGFADDTAIAPRADHVIAIEKALFFGHVPTIWLQDHLFSPARLGPVDWLTVQVHWSYFFVPHVAAALVWIFRRELFPRFVFLVLGTFYVGLVLYFLFPTVPPWLAADYGALPYVPRVMDYVGHQVDGETYTRLYDAMGVPNAVAAMPSLHMGITFAVYLFTRDVSRRLARVMLAYSLLMGFSLVYMGEHYATDVLVGILCAALVHRIWLLHHRRQSARTAADGGR
jgi:membrane-associated phospholipid phosphatase